MEAITIVTHITSAMRQAIGRTIGTRVSFPISESDIRRWAVAVYYPADPPPQFWDAEYAAATRHQGIVAPEEFNPFAWMAAKEHKLAIPIDANNPDRTELMLGIDGPGLKFQLNGGQEVEYRSRMRPGDVITETSRLSDYYEREGRLGLMLFTVSEIIWANQHGQDVRRYKQILIRY
jgi:N-terminal half of MaoC dehydratase